MFHNYLITALRNFARHKLYSFINIAGLAIGLACVILIALFVRDEVSFDTWVPDSADLYRVEETFFLPGRPPLRFGSSDFPLAALLKDNLPEVIAMTRFWPRDKTVAVGDRTFSQRIVEVDSNFFDVIHFPLMAGDPATALSRPDSIVISRALGVKLFGAVNPIGHTLGVNRAACAADTVSCINDLVILHVAGVMADLPHNTHVQADALMPHTSPADSITELGKQSYFAINGYSYIKLSPGSDPTRVLAKVPKLLDQHIDVLKDLGMKLQASKTIEVHLTPFVAVHLAGADMGNMVPAGSRLLLYGLVVIGLLILLVACFNFTNLATARATARAREIALRKCAGARRTQLIAQFLGESVLMALMALILALSLVEIALPAYDAFLDRPLNLHYADWPFLLIILGIAVSSGLLGGVYPSLLLSRFSPAPVLRTNSPGHTGSSKSRNVLVVLQFAVAIGLAVMTLVVFAQIDFMRRQSLGFRRDNILVISTNRRMAESARESFLEQLRRHPGIVDVAMSGDVPFSGSTMVAQMRLPGHPEYLTLDRQVVTPEFFRLYDMHLMAGRFLSNAFGQDRLKSTFPDGLANGLNIMVNHTAAERFGFSAENAVGKAVLFGPYQVRIVGVLADTRVDGARAPSRAIVYIDDPFDTSFLSLRIVPEQTAQVTSFVDKAWRHFAPNVAIERYFLDENFNQLYSAEEKQGQMFSAFVAIAIAIACLGLFGLAAFTAGRRTREIGIRKVFGARTLDLMRMLLWQFSLPIVLANGIAWPLAWYALHVWLQGFADRISLNPFYFLTAGLAALAIAWTTILGHTLRVARANPIRALRYE